MAGVGPVFPRLSLVRPLIEKEVSKNMRFNLPLIATLSLTLGIASVTACLGKKESTPKSVAQRYLNAVKNGDCDEIIDLIDWEGVQIQMNGPDRWFQLSPEERQDILAGQQEIFRNNQFEEFRKRFEKQYSFSVEITNEVVSGTFAEVYVKSLRREEEGKTDPPEIKLARIKGEWKIFLAGYLDPAGMRKPGTPPRKPPSQPNPKSGKGGRKKAKKRKKAGEKK